MFLSFSVSACLRVFCWCRFQLQEERKRLVEEAKRLVERMEEMERQERIAAMTQRHASPDRLRTHTFHTTTSTVASAQLHSSREASPSRRGLSSPFHDATLMATSPRAGLSQASAAASGSQGTASHLLDMLVWLLRQQGKQVPALSRLGHLVVAGYHSKKAPCKFANFGKPMATTVAHLIASLMRCHHNPLPQMPQNRSSSNWTVCCPWKARFTTRRLLPSS